ncbi:hypothetical protein QFZ82_002299 [Streptomyces sp. V4I23]|nr:hypothetical protein [Streptomyces sp. V4I23]
MQYELAGVRAFDADGATHLAEEYVHSTPDRKDALP